MKCWERRPQTQGHPTKVGGSPRGGLFPLKNSVTNNCRGIPRYQDLLFSLLISLRQRTFPNIVPFIEACVYCDLWFPVVVASGYEYCYLVVLMECAVPFTGHQLPATHKDKVSGCYSRVLVESGRSIPPLGLPRA